MSWLLRKRSAHFPYRYLQSADLDIGADGWSSPNTSLIATVAAILFRCARNSLVEGQGRCRCFISLPCLLTSPTMLPFCQFHAAVAILGRKILICACEATVPRSRGRPTIWPVETLILRAVVDATAASAALHGADCAVYRYLMCRLNSVCVDVNLCLVLQNLIVF